MRGGYRELPVGRQDGTPGGAGPVQTMSPLCEELEVDSQKKTIKDIQNTKTIAC